MPSLTEQCLPVVVLFRCSVSCCSLPQPRRRVETLSQFEVGSRDGDVVELPVSSSRALPVCQYDAVGCTRRNPQHFTEFSHPSLDRKRAKERQARTVVDIGV